MGFLTREELRSLSVPITVYVQLFLPYVTIPTSYSDFIFRLHIPNDHIPNDHIPNDHIPTHHILFEELHFFEHIIYYLKNCTFLNILRFALFVWYILIIPPPPPKDLHFFRA